WHLNIADDTAGGVGTLHCWSLSIVPSACQAGGGPCEPCSGPIVGAITNTDLIQSNRLFRNGIASDCDNKPCPGEVSPSPGIIHYDSYRFTNNGPAACVLVTLTTPCNGGGPGDDSIHSSAYLNSYDPANKCLHYGGDIGNSPNPSSGYTFLV